MMFLRGSEAIPAAVCIVIEQHYSNIMIYFTTVTEVFMSVEVSPRPVEESSAGVMMEFGVSINDTVRFITSIPW